MLFSPSSIFSFILRTQEKGELQAVKALKARLTNCTGISQILRSKKRICK